MNADEQIEEIHKYEDFLENVLQKDLENLLKQKEEVLVKIQEIQKLERNVSIFKEMNLSELNTRTNLGCDVYVDTLIPDLSKICVELSFGFFLELNLDEIPNILSLKQEFEHSKIEKLNHDISSIKARIKVVSLFFIIINMIYITITIIILICFDF
ncbi:Prefoldin alpha-like protein [Cryptosporidium parvum]|uniref:Uncharacterized protein n=1 Tax=Cryptosporidium parvum TaxID=5807 RepID=A0A7S7RGK4_CRYPV|nr:Prefoldin alpha-like protein [Cryptosporidium parvum]WRK32062.1 Prefoldin alpha-like protein [Cryptosporidium parvum]|eukprot:QOY41966.1 hypothetical protein CPATCC_001558 [Cryptosporidium parvum]